MSHLRISPVVLAITCLALAITAWQMGASVPAIAASGAQPGASAWWQTGEGRVRLISATGAVGATAELRLGMQFKLEPGWKIYWRSPGSAGFPPRLDWTGSTNLAATDMRWPAPKRFRILGLDTLGYTDEVVFPIAVRPVQPGMPVRLRAALDYLTCKEVCIPYRTMLDLALPAGEAYPTRFAHLIDRFAARVPGVIEAQGLAIERAVVRGRPGTQLLEVVARAQTPFGGPDLFVEGLDTFEFGAPTVTLTSDGREANLRLPIFSLTASLGSIAGQDVVLTLVDDDRAIETTLTVQAGQAPVDPPNTLIGILALAILGGLILNLMPCVLPVLSIKLLSVVGLGGQSRRTIRVSFLASAAGILSSFMVLAGATAIVKASGVSVGWGMQFQQPVFLIAMTLILTLFACNLWGWFEVRLPSALADRAVRMGSDGHSHGLSGHFLTGALATLLATPCSAPFLGTAVGFALFRGPVEIFAVFAALGLGLALPYLLIAAAPALAASLPRPGPWMVILRRVLGFALAATAVWLLTVLAVQRGDVAAWGVGGLMAATGALLWIARAKAARLRLMAVAALALLAFAVVGQFEPRRAATVAEDSEAVWRPFNRVVIAAFVSNGKTVIVDVTADWCITCQVNKSIVLESGPVLERLRDSDVVAMRADWTNPNAAIAAYLASFGRYGIPFNVVYGPARPEGPALPELLTREAVLQALSAAADDNTVVQR